MRNFIKKITHPFLRIGTKIWFSKPRKYAYKGVKVMVHPDVFPPHYTISTKILLDFIDNLGLAKTSLFEQVVNLKNGVYSGRSETEPFPHSENDLNLIAVPCGKSP